MVFLGDAAGAGDFLGDCCAVVGVAAVAGDLGAAVVGVVLADGDLVAAAVSTLMASIGLAPLAAGFFDGDDCGDAFAAAGGGGACSLAAHLAHVHFSCMNTAGSFSSLIFSSSHDYYYYLCLPPTNSTTCKRITSSHIHTRKDVSYFTL